MMNNISAGANYTPQSYITNAANSGAVDMKKLAGMQHTPDEEDTHRTRGEDTQLSKLAQQTIDETQKQQQGHAAENAHQSGADSEIMDDLNRDGNEENEVHERGRQHELGKSKDGRAVVPGHGADAQRTSTNVAGHDEAGVEISDIGRSPEEVLSDVPGHSAAFARGSVEAQLANPGQVDKLTEIKPLPDQQRIEADSPELQPVQTLGPVLGDKETGEVSHPSPSTEGRAPTSVAQEFDPEQMKHMEQVVAEQALAREQAGEGEMLIAGGGAAGNSNGVSQDLNARKSEVNTNFLNARNELLESTSALDSYGWSPICGQILQQHGGNEGAAAHDLAGRMHGILMGDAGLKQIWNETSGQPDGHKQFVDRSRQYMVDNGHKYDASDLDCAGKMLTCYDKCNNFLAAGNEAIQTTGRVPSKAEMDQLSEKLFGSVSSGSSAFQSDFKAQMNELGQQGKLNENNMSQAAGSVSANVAAKHLDRMDTSKLFSPPGQTDEEAEAAQTRALAKKKQWEQEGVDGTVSDALAFEQSAWANQKMQQQPNPKLAAYQSQVNEYIQLNATMRQGYGLMTNNVDYYEKSAYAGR